MSKLGEIWSIAYDDKKRQVKHLLVPKHDPFLIASMGRLYIYLHEWLIFMVNIGKYTYTIHGCHGFRDNGGKEAAILSPIITDND